MHACCYNDMRVIQVSSQYANKSNVVIASTLFFSSFFFLFIFHFPQAARVAALVGAWFLDNATAMNPNLNHAQAVPGSNNGTGGAYIAQQCRQKKENSTDACIHNV